jgi:hypothetical protein
VELTPPQPIPSAAAIAEPTPAQAAEHPKLRAHKRDAHVAKKTASATPVVAAPPVAAPAPAPPRSRPVEKW